MITKLKAIYDQGVLRLKESLPLPDGTEVPVTVTSQEAVDERSQPMDDQSWNALTKLLAGAIDTGVSDLARQHDHYLHGFPKRP